MSYSTPVQPASSVQQKQAKASSVNIEATVRILIVEDNLVAGKAAQITIKRLYNYCVCDRAATGKEALKLAQTNPYDFILMDIGLPDIDGNEVTRQIRAFHSPQQAQVPIIGLTGHASDWDKKEEAIAAGMHEVFEKPLTDSGLEVLMQQYVFNRKEGEAVITETQSPKKSKKIVPIIDWDQCIKQFNGDETTVRELLADLAIDLKLTQEKVTELYADKENDALRAELHRVNGGIAYFSLPQLSQALTAFHEAVKEDPQQGKRLEKTYAAFQEAINTLLTTIAQMDSLKIK